MCPERFRRSCSVAVGVFLALGAPKISFAVPRLVSDAVEFHFGTVTEGEKVRRDFRIQNTGDTELVLDRIVPSCGCTASVVDNQRIPPQSETMLHVEFDTNGFAGGERVKAVRVYSNDPARPVTMYTLKGVIASQISVDPLRLVFGDVAHGQEVAGTIRVQTQPGFRVRGAQSYSPALTVEPGASEATSQVFNVKFKADVPFGEFRDRIILTVDGKNERSVNVPVFARIIGDLRLQPSVVSFGVIEGKAKMTRSVEVQPATSGPLSGLQARTSHPAVQAEIGRNAKTGRAEVVVSVDPTRATGDVRTVVEVFEESGKARRASFNVVGIVPPKV